MFVICQHTVLNPDEHCVDCSETKKEIIDYCVAQLKKFAPNLLVNSNKPTIHIHKKSDPSITIIRGR